MIPVTNAITTIPLNQLCDWDGNPRRVEDLPSLESLAANIAALGILQPLIVIPHEDISESFHAYRVIAGGRRFHALQHLLLQGKVAEDFAVPCVVAEDALNPEEIALAENVMRLDMHPADQFESFQRLVREGMSPDAIAHRFGVTRAIVDKRLKLARVNPTLIDAYRGGELGLEELQAYAVSDDWERQQRCFDALENAQEWEKSPDKIRAAMTVGEIPGTDKRVRFVGLETYEAAGGTVRRDLFSDGFDGIYIEDEALLDRLVGERLQQETTALSAEGWSWIHATPDFSYRDKTAAKMKDVPPMVQPLSPEDQEALNRLEEEQAAIAGKVADEEISEEEFEALDKKYDALTEQIDAIEEKKYVWTESIKSTAGVILTIDRNGNLDIERGLVRPEDAKKIKSSRTDVEGEDGNPEGDNAEHGEDDRDAKTEKFKGVGATFYSLYRAAAIAAAVKKQPALALRILVHRLLDTHFNDSPLRITPYEVDYGKDLLNAGDCTGLEHLRTPLAHDPTEKSEDSLDLWHRLKGMTTDGLMELLADRVAQTLDLIDRQGYGDILNGIEGEIAEEVQTEAQAMIPLPEAYFSRLKKPLLVAALAEATGASLTAAQKPMKRDALAQFVAREIALNNPSWRPEVLRIGEGYKSTQTTQSTEAEKETEAKAEEGTDEQVQDAMDCLDYLYASTFYSKSAAKNVEIASIIRRGLEKRNANKIDPAVAELSQCGIKVISKDDQDSTPTQILIARKNGVLEGLFHETRWKNGAWADVLKHLNGTPIKNAVRFGGSLSRAIEIPHQYWPVADAEDEVAA